MVDSFEPIPEADSFIPEAFDPPIVTELFEADFLPSDALEPDILDPDSFASDALVPETFDSETLDADFFDPDILDADNFDPDFLGSDTFDADILDAFEPDSFASASSPSSSKLSLGLEERNRLDRLASDGFKLDEALAWLPAADSFEAFVCDRRSEPAIAASEAFDRLALCGYQLRLHFYLFN